MGEMMPQMMEKLGPSTNPTPNTDQPPSPWGPRDPVPVLSSCLARRPVPVALAGTVSFPRTRAQT